MLQHTEITISDCVHKRKRHHAATRHSLKRQLTSFLFVFFFGGGGGCCGPWHGSSGVGALARLHVLAWSETCPESRNQKPHDSRRRETGEQNGGVASLNVFKKKNNNPSQLAVSLLCVPLFTPHLHLHHHLVFMPDTAEGAGPLQEQSLHRLQTLSLFISLHISLSSVGRKTSEH